MGVNAVGIHRAGAEMFVLFASLERHSNMISDAVKRVIKVGKVSTWQL